MAEYDGFLGYVGGKNSGDDSGDQKIFEDLVKSVEKSTVISNLERAQYYISEAIKYLKGEQKDEIK